MCGLGEAKAWANLFSFRLAEKAGKNPIIFVAPDVAKLIPQLSGWNMMLDVIKKFKEIINEHVDRHRKEQTENENPRDFIDAYLKEIKETTDPSSSFYKDAGSKQRRLH